MTSDRFDDALAAVTLCSRCSASLVHDRRSARCTTCGASYESRDGILDLVAPELSLGNPPVGQGAMESRVIAAVYESILWRRTHTWLSGISLKREMAQILAWLRPTKGEPLLDLGCGPGLYARAMARAHTDSLVVGVDLSMPMLLRASKLVRKAALSNVRLVRADIRSLPFRVSSFTAAHAGGVVHLISELTTVWQEVSRALQDDGSLTVMTVLRARGLIGAAQVRAERRGRGSFRSAEEIESELRDAGFGEFECDRRGLMLLIHAQRTPQ